MARTAKPKAKAKAAANQKKAATARSKTVEKATKPTAAPKPDAGNVGNVGWATDLVFDVKEAKLAVSLRLDADVLRFFRGFGAGYQTRINEVLRSFMDARQRAGLVPPAALPPAALSAAPRKSGRSRAR